MDKFHREDIEASYALMEIEEVSAIREVISSDDLLCGFNVTIPYKESILPYLDELSSEAKAIGAVNCVVIENGCLKGYNTDVEGISKSLDMLDIAPSCKALIFGSGGACKAVKYILKRRGIDYKVVSRDAKRGDIAYGGLTSDIIAEHTLLINTTPLGMYPDIDSAPDIDYDAVTSSHKAFDLVYNPEPTLFMRKCMERGATVIGGLRMLHIQAEASWRIWNL